MAENFDETDIIERLNQAPTVRGFFVAAVDTFETAIDGLIKRVFRKDNFAVESVVGPLLHDTGPLGDLSVRLKLLFGLGVLSDDAYHDIEQIIKLKNQLSNDADDYQFTDPKVLDAVKKLRKANTMGMLSLDIGPPEDDVDIEFYQLQLQRQQQVIRSGLSLAIVEICNELSKESPF
ncbi:MULTISPECIES: MltR family transcriptional regulator [unclassified Salinivibrio]|uniref:MltR family transcriptional regulator n=2 Tax=Salinivibrio TaxID=51366 RepID=UPI0006146390|nr:MULTISPECIES: MltR family transcriptional regulator [unclassified Salinivibrio]KKA43618.1 mannitol operon repressor [Salinivibrio sp. KP-1]OOE67559.1 mannitol operon repressor [Salinivibrio sp. IB868]OOE70791.1 mannitol operon repressor [Salinivibrio sp. IB870]OOE72085.1 mannitol operon repressor [Salinivibrio sp. ML290]OOE82397.1 mannitol operon repressor [Salinivibrio sp. ML198]